MKFRVEVRERYSDHGEVYVSGWLENKLIVSLWCDRVDKQYYTDHKNVTRYRFDCSKDGTTIAILHEDEA